MIKPVITQMTLLMVALLLAAANIEAASYTALYSFSPSADNLDTGQSTNYDGTSPEANLLLSSNTLYGTAYDGGSNGYGTVFKVSINGTGFTVLHTFTAPPDLVTNSDGINPRSSLVLSSNVLYGTTSGGGTNGVGTIFAVNTNGTGFTNVFTFGSVSPSGDSPQAGLTLSGKTLYGTTSAGGLNNGTVFRINTDGTAFTNLYSFSTGGSNSYSINTNSDGSQPYGVLVLSNNVLYGTTQLGGVSGAGTVFRINSDGTAFTNLHSFNAVVTSDLQHITNSDGANPWSGLVLSGNTLYGTTYDGGTNATGTVFKVNTDGTGFTNLCSFNGISSSSSHNIGGANPYSSLVLSGNTLYGTANQGGSSGGGTVFTVNTNGTGFTNLFNFNGANTNGNLPYAGFVLSGNTMYGTTTDGGSGTNGTIFVLTLPGPIPLNIKVTGGKLVLNWTNTAFSLQASATVSGTFSNVTGATSPYTNTTTGSQQFFRLQAN
jgi:uncharacterized repeat protein (TIGR03803 family)